MRWVGKIPCITAREGRVNRIAGNFGMVVLLNRRPFGHIRQRRLRISNEHQSQILIHHPEFLLSHGVRWLKTIPTAATYLYKMGKTRNLS